MGSVKIDVGSALPYLIEKGLAIFGRDSESLEVKEWFSELQNTALLDASNVQVIGMHTPLPISSIYQPTRIQYPASMTRGPKNEIVPIPARTLSTEKFLEQKDNALIFAGPGWGKTTFLHHLFVRLITNPNIVPVLFTLRRTTAVADLERFKEVISKLKGKRSSSEFLLLVDGYDEISTENRKRVSEALLRFAASQTGRFYLTCRDFYDVLDVKAPHVRIAPFSASDQLGYMSSFLKAYGYEGDPANIISDLTVRGFDDFLKHPLLLALACIVRTGPVNLHSRSVMKLIEVAVDTLSLRWDQSKGISRQSYLPLDGKDRVRCLMRVAFHSNKPRTSKKRAEELTQDQLDLVGSEGLDAERVLFENAQFYGIFVPGAEDDWVFVHRTLHDYLAARFWVETGSFQPGRVNKWNARAAYAACLVPDATHALLAALADRQNWSGFAEILSNEPAFRHREVARALMQHYQNANNSYFFEADRQKIVGQLNPDFVSIASTKFLINIINTCLAEGRFKISDVMLAYSLSEMQRRGNKISPILYSSLLNTFKSPRFNFTVHKNSGWNTIALEQLRPAEWVE